MIDHAVAAIKNAVNVSVKEEHGEDAYVHSTIIVSLVELPRSPDDGPGAERFRTAVSMTDPLSMKPAIQMLEDAATVIRMQEGERS